jgi:hypothetical protein
VSEFGWLILGWCTGILSLMQVQVWREWRKRRNPLQMNPNFVPMEQRLSDWSTAELDIPVPFIPTPREITPVLQECPHCGRGYKRVAQHIRMAHKVKVEDE